ncbi:MAG: hypothetical protein CL693_11330 [Cellvibrionaceae bacterium]|nr:hypothetical protein [Cellvibrionaceae bacterium]|tara:strand:- start:5 stop:1432 length:1428 start_codon:yes stop_codon:yes gene_type:complete
MNSNVADVNISALLNLGVKPSTKEFEQKAGNKDDSFDRHLSEQAQKQNRASADDGVVKEPKSNSQPTAGQSASDTSSPGDQSGSSQVASNDDVQSDTAGGSDREEETAHESSSVADDDKSAERRGGDALQQDPVAADGIDPLVSEPLAAEEVLVDVPADTNISLENIVKAVSSVIDPQSPEAESVDAVLDDLVESIVPTHGAQVAPAVASQASDTKVSKPDGSLRPSASLLNAATQAGSIEDAEGLELPETPPADPKLTATKLSEAPLSQTAQQTPVTKLQTPTTLAAAVASAVDSVVKDTAGTKGEGASSTREASPLVAISQRGGTRPLNVQQGNAQFSMPTQAKAGQPQWQTAVAERVAVMASQRITSAEIQLDPPELGQLQVRVTLNQEQASVSFSSQHAVVREALDQTAHRLRDMFDAEGLDLVDVDVSDQSFHQGQGEEGGGGDGFVASDEISAEPEMVKVSQGLVDQFV